jgi:hypothetical protein
VEFVRPDTFFLKDLETMGNLEVLHGWGELNVVLEGQVDLVELSACVHHGLIALNPLLSLSQGPSLGKRFSAFLMIMVHSFQVNGELVSA